MLYQKTRPTNLDEVIGNQPAVTALRNVLRSKEHAHAFIFRGPSGCGKTTLARILADKLNCNEMNVQEINAADSRGIDMVRRLEEQAAFFPMGGGNKIVILDEAHMLTREAQNALLKILEDIPTHQYYALCSTEPNKILKTIQTRCDHIQVSLLDEEDTIKVLEQAVEKEGLDISTDEVFFAISDAAQGCPRTALVLLEKQQGLDEKEALDVIKSYGLATKEVIDLCRALVEGSWNSVISTYKKIQDKDAEKVRRAVLGYLSACLQKSKGSKGERFAVMIEELMEHTYDSGEPGLLAMLYRASRK